MAPGKLYVIPCSIHDSNQHILLPQYLEILSTIRIFIVENIRTSRRFIKSILPQFDINACTFIEIDKHAAHQNFEEAWTMIAKGFDLGLMSEAGSPGIADPGSKIIAEAHGRNVSVHPWIGPTSITLALMASGLNGQSFTFHGYLPSKSKDELHKKLKAIEQTAWTTGYSQICIETPYRNTSLLETMLQVLMEDTILCIGVDLSGTNEQIISKSLQSWKKSNSIDLQKRPAIFILNRPTLVE